MTGACVGPAPQRAGRPGAPALDRYSAAGEYERHRSKALRLLQRRFPRLDPDERLDLYHAAWIAVLAKRQRGEGDEIENVEAYLIGAVDRLALKRLACADTRRRTTFDPTQSELAELPDGAASPEERVVAMDEARITREIIQSLAPGERDVAKLRFGLGLEPSEVCARLGIGERQYRRLVERASRRIAERVAAPDEEARSRRQLSLLRACLAGIASERQVQEARDLLATDPKARALLRTLRSATERVAALLPLPAVVGGGGAARVADLAEMAKQRLADLTSGGGGRAAETTASVKHQLTSVYLRASDPTPLSGVRPGAVAAAVAGCIAVGGGTLCAVEGVPAPIKPALGIEQKADAKQKPPPETKLTEHVDRPAVPPREPPAQPSPSAPAAQAEPSAAASPAPPSESQEFFGQDALAGGGEPAPAPSTSRARSVPASSDGAAEFGP